MEENLRTRRKTLGARQEPTTNSAHIWHRAEIEPHWWEASALTTAPTLLLHEKKKIIYFFAIQGCKVMLS